MLNNNNNNNNNYNNNNYYYNYNYNNKPSLAKKRRCRSSRVSLRTHHVDLRQSALSAMMRALSAY